MPYAHRARYERLECIFVGTSIINLKILKKLMRQNFAHEKKNFNSDGQILSKR